jgi:hypothetical protein
VDNCRMSLKTNVTKRLSTTKQSLIPRLVLLPVALAAIPLLTGQTKPEPAKSSAVARSNAWTVPRTSYGVPDLQGIWLNGTLTPLERPEKFGDPTIFEADQRLTPLAIPGGIGQKWINIFKAGPTLTDGQAEEFEKLFRSSFAADERKSKRDTDAAVEESYNSLFFDLGNNLARIDGVARTSLIVDPMNGHIPPSPPEAMKRAFAQYALNERCLIGMGSTTGPPILPTEYNNYHQIVQTPQRIMIMSEMIHDVREIYMDRTQHLPRSLRLWFGDSIGHWEGDTLVVDTTNFSEKTSFAGSTSDLHVVEWFNLIGTKTILYKATIDDPKTWASPWTIEYPFYETGERIFEYACHEGNYAMMNILRGNRK